MSSPKATSGEDAFRLTVNEREVTVSASRATSLVDVLREEVGLTGSNIGCRTGDCGACTVLIGDMSAKSCVVLAGAAEGQPIRTIDDFRGDPLMDTIRTAFTENFGFQCGFCLPGMLLTTYELLARTETPTEAEMVQAVNGNLCRCTGYQFIIRSVHAAVAALAAGATSGRAS